MGLFSKLFKKKNTVADLGVMFAEASPECKKLLALKNQMDSLLSDDRYVAKSEYNQMPKR